MFDVEMYLQKLRAMDPCDVAAMVKKALDNANVEYSDVGTGILFDGLFAADQVSILCSTSFTDAQSVRNRKIYSYIGKSEVNSAILSVKGVCTSTDFDASDYALAA